MITYCQDKSQQREEPIMARLKLQVDFGVDFAVEISA
ncbi:MAG: hypothetical protein V7641_3630 [Blastocatellia bacterium]